MDAERPGIAICLDHLRLAREGGVVLPDVALVDAWLEVAAVLHAIGWVHVDHLDFAGHALAFQQRVHDDERVAQNEAVRPIDIVLIELHRFAERQLRIGEQAELLDLRATNSVDDRLCRDALVDVERDGFDINARCISDLDALQPRLAGPDELRREVWVVGVLPRLRLLEGRLVAGQPDRRVVLPRLVIPIRADQLLRLLHHRRPLARLKLTSSPILAQTQGWLQPPPSAQAAQPQRSQPTEDNASLQDPPPARRSAPPRHPPPQGRRGSRATLFLGVNRGWRWRGSS